ncbi:tetratricopeptide repeat protein [Klebsiella aerogenes]|uniref:tetratricopeptide repeat protein n=1 Tax=Klebsiella aerogenes TaxID=548 RepID=UPI0037AD7B6E
MRRKKKNYTPPPSGSRVSPVNPRMQAQLQSAASAFREAMKTGHFQDARKHCESVLALTPGNPSVMGDYALTLMRCGEYQHAWKIYTRMFRHQHQQQFQGNWLDGLAEVCGWLGKKDELRYYGHYALSKADQQCGGGKKYPLPSERPPRFSPSQYNVIAFSLYGNHPRYCETMVKNAELAPDIYPGWHLRVYHDDTVPGHVLTRLRRMNVELVDMTGTANIVPTMWRFLVLDDPQVIRYLVRDADALLSEKESAAVTEWLGSGTWFHHMRDYFTHTELLLAGMWGGHGGVFPSVSELIREFLQTYKGTPRYTDQQFLRQILWPTVRTSLYNHDEIFRFGQAHPYPPSRQERWSTEAFHIGSNAAYTALGGKVTSPGVRQVAIEFSAEGDVIRYPAEVRGGQWSLPVPFFLADACQNGVLQVNVVAD